MARLRRSAGRNVNLILPSDQFSSDTFFHKPTSQLLLCLGSSAKTFMNKLCEEEEEKCGVHWADQKVLKGHFIIL